VSTTAGPNASLLTYPDVMTRIIRRVGPRATETPRGQRVKAPPRRSRAFVFAISYAGFGGPSQVRAVASTVVASPPFWFPLSMRGPAVLATCAQEIYVSNNTEKKEVVSDKCHKVRFYFRHVIRRPAELAFSRDGDTFSRLGHANVRAAEHEALPIHAQWCTSRSSAPISLSM
jgi:hypothetical protein